MSVKLIEFDGKIASISEHCRVLGISLATFYQRIKKTGETPEECLLYYKENLKKDMIEFNGKIAKVAEHCKDLGIKPNTLYARHHKTNESYEECLKYYQYHGVAHKPIDFNGKLASLIEHCNDLEISLSTVAGRHQRTNEPYEKCLEYYQNNGVKHKNRKYKVKDRRLYTKWHNAKDRCENPKNPMYCWYGEKGIKVCDRWQIYENFENDMLESFLAHVKEFGIKDTTLERDDYNKDYCPSNCSWKTRKEQANNKSSNRIVTDELNIAQFAEKYNMNYKTLLYRLNAGWSIERILNTPINQADNVCKYFLPCNNNTKQLKEHCKQNSYKYTTIINYIKKYNLEPQEALAKYLENRKDKLN